MAELLAFDQDEFTWTENPRKPLQFSGSIAVRQVLPGGLFSIAAQQAKRGERLPERGAGAFDEAGYLLAGGASLRLIFAVT